MIADWRRQGVRVRALVDDHPAADRLFVNVIHAILQDPRP
jgi:hypothetical protein